MGAAARAGAPLGRTPRGLRVALRRVNGGPLAVYTLGVLWALLDGPQLLPTLEISNLGLRSGGLSFRDATSFSLPPATLGWSLLPSYGLVDLERASSTRPHGASLWPMWGCWGVGAGAAGRMGRARARLACGHPLCAAGAGAGAGALEPRMVCLARGPSYPGFDLFRTPARGRLMLYTLGGALLAGLGAEWLLARRAQRAPPCAQRRGARPFGARRHRACWWRRWRCPTRTPRHPRPSMLCAAHRLPAHRPRRVP